MMNTPTIALTTVFASLLTAGTALAGGEGWTHDFAAAKKQAAEENKSLLMDFTGSDWCGWCIKLNKEVFQHDAFKQGVKDTLVLVELDFPRDKSKLSEETIEQNNRLNEVYAIQGYPTIILADAEGKPFGRTGYQQGGPDAYVDHLNELLKGKTVRDEAFARAAKQEGAEKAKTLSAALQAMGLEDSLVMGLYGDVVASIKQADPDDASGFVAGMERKAKFAEIESQLSTHYRAGDHDAALKLVNSTLDEGMFDGEQKQMLTMIKGLVLAELKKTDEALATLDAAEKIAPGSEMVGAIEYHRNRLNDSRETPTEE